MPEFTSISLRPLHIGDATKLMEFYNGLSPASIRTFRPLGDKTTLEVCLDIMRDSTANQPTRLDVVACWGTGIRGWAFLRALDTDRPELGLGVLDGFQGQGLGGALIDRLLDGARGQAIPKVYLIAVKDNLRAIRLYQSKGFVQYGEFFSEQDQLLYVRMAAILSPGVVDPTLRVDNGQAR